MNHSELKEATNDFDENLIIAKGGFGVVYKASNFRSSGTIVAVKMLNKVNNTVVLHLLSTILQDGVAALKASSELQLEAEVFALTKLV